MTNSYFQEHSAHIVGSSFRKCTWGVKGAEEMAYSIKCSLYECTNMSSIARTYVREPICDYTVIKEALERQIEPYGLPASQPSQSSDHQSK